MSRTRHKYQDANTSSNISRLRKSIPSNPIGSSCPESRLTVKESNPTSRVGSAKKINELI